MDEVTLKGLLALAAMFAVFEAFAILPSLGWGQPHSIGHFIDLWAAILGLTLVFIGLVVQAWQWRD